MLYGLLACVLSVCHMQGQATTALSRQGWYADPEIHVFSGQYWVYPTTSLPTRTPMQE